MLSLSMKGVSHRPKILFVLAVSLLLSLGSGTSPIAQTATPTIADSTAAPGDVQVPPPPFSEGIFPCSDCHEAIEPNPERRQLKDFHEDIVFRHDEKNRWCLDCHDKENRDVLRLASGQTISFERSYLLCGQCHGPKLRDWKAGVHGLRTGYWNGKKTYLLCAHCHNPHHPRYPPVKPLPAPVPPDQLRESLERPYEPIVLKRPPGLDTEKE